MKNKALMFCILLFAFSIAYSQNAQQHVNVGYDLFIKKQYSGAYKEFKKAIELDPGMAVAYYNIACIDSIFLEDLCSEKVIYIEDIKAIFPMGLYNQYIEKNLIQTFKKACELEYNYKLMSLSDPDLDYFRKYFDYYQILGYSLTSTNDLYEIITNVLYWRMVFPGLDGWAWKMNFNKNFTFKITDTRFHPKYETITGKYYFIEKDQKILIGLEFDKEYYKRKSIIFEIMNNGIIKSLEPFFEIFDEDIRAHVNMSKEFEAIFRPKYDIGWI